MKRNKTLFLCRTAIFAAVLCIIGPIAVPIGISPVPLTLFSFAVCLFSYCVKPIECCIGIAVYLLIGSVGLPVFASGLSGIGVLLGPTGGYLIGYLFFGLICARSAKMKKRMIRVLGMIVAVAVLYLFGTVWYCFICDVGFVTAVSLCVLPYLAGDAVKIAAAEILGKILQKELYRAGILSGHGK